MRHGRSAAGEVFDVDEVRRQLGRLVTERLGQGRAFRGQLLEELRLVVQPVEYLLALLAEKLL
jgi:hypothetical protein